MTQYGLRCNALMTVAAFAVLLVAACGSDPVDRGRRSRDHYPVRSEDKVFDCPPAAFAKFSGSTKHNPPLLELTFRGEQPTSAVAEAAIRSCAATALKQVSIDEEMLGRAWWSQSGLDVDDDAVSLVDSNTNLVVFPDGRVKSWGEWRGDAVSFTEAADRRYFVRHELTKTAVQPVRPLAYLQVVFTAPPTHDEARGALIEEMQKAIAAGVDAPLSGSAWVGQRDNPAGWVQIGKPGAYLSMDFKPGSAYILADGKSVAPARK